MKHLVVTIEKAGPPAPKRKAPPPPPKVEYPFHLIPLNGSARMPRSRGAIMKKLYEYTHSEKGKSQRFLVREIAKGVCRVWRIQ